ncbi:zymogen granule membrane protein 16-like [Centropristis striata]|uniref:zymogen granule membrane protein 16-like n=1 Tax=Centropristis striata TaxID=184440 RepID=UPI0027DF849C|nr:zymogen granule membrane protein 16-like [Centropristis striata]
MFTFLFLAAFCASCLAAPSSYFYSPAVGPGAGSSFSTQGDGGITGLRVWERNNAYITGIQVSNGNIWGPVFGRSTGHILHEIELFDGETITQVSGKHTTSYIYQVIFLTSRGRALIAGQPTTTSFNLYGNKPDQVLMMLSGRHNTAGITSLGAHWGVSNTTDH